MKKSLIVLALALGMSACQQQQAPAPAPAPAPTPAPAAPAKSAAELFQEKLDGVLAGAQRNDANKARDQFRRPKETLNFFGIAPGQTVIEITPGGGWYTEILGPLLKGQGTFVAAIPDAAKYENQRARDFYIDNNKKYRDKIAADDPSYSEVQVLEFDPNAPSFGAPGSADMVVTFRNVHNWTGGGTDDEMFKAFFDVLKPGGVLGVEEHRANAGVDSKTSARTGYVTEEYVIGLATAAGFELAEKAEINANPKDTKDHPNGVWNLPPTLNVKEGDDRAKYEAIGESDRMTLKFVRPAAAAAQPATAPEPTPTTDAPRAG
jgi:predicted methyltransferase